MVQLMLLTGELFALCFLIFLMMTAKFFDYGERLERLESERGSKGFGSSSRFKKKKKWN